MDAKVSPQLPDAANDDALMRRVGMGDALAFRTLVERHAARPHRIAWRMLGDASEAEDVAQEAMLKLWRDGRRWDARGAGVAAWLARVATNLSLDRLRQRCRMELGGVPERIDDSLSADQGIERDQRAETVRRALDGLPDRQRAALILTYYEEMSNAAAADVLQVHIKAFESMLHRARRAMMAQLIEETSDA